MSRFIFSKKRFRAAARGRHFIECAADFINHCFICRISLFLPIICCILFWFPFHSFPVLSLICNVISFVASIGKEYPFPKMSCILLVGKFPKPSDFPLTTYNTEQSDFAEVLREI